jgi:hypothetical protein
MSDLFSKLAISKAIMDKHSSMGRGTASAENYNTQSTNYNVQAPMVEEYDVPNSTYNIPQELLAETKPTQVNPNPPTKDRIINSKLPDEIKRLMIENPIVATNPLVGGGPVLSEELVEKASKLMGLNKQQQPINENVTPKGQSKGQHVLDNKEMRKLMKEVVQEVLKENGLIVESSDSTNESMVIKVGQHIFEGKISKIKKLKK